MGSLDSPQASTVKRKIVLIDWTAYTPEQLENVYNTTYGAKGWRVIQVLVVGSSKYLVAEREV